MEVGEVVADGVERLEIQVVGAAPAKGDVVGMGV
jgi:hypothetical protein